MVLCTVFSKIQSTALSAEDGEMNHQTFINDEEFPLTYVNGKQYYFILMIFYILNNRIITRMIIVKPSYEAVPILDSFTSCLITLVYVISQ